MRKTKWLIMTLMTAATVVALAGCGSSNPSATSSSGSSVQNGTAVHTSGSNQVNNAGQPSNKTGFTGRGRRGNFQPNMTMTVNPTSPTAGKAFTVSFAMQRPNRGTVQGGTTKNASGGNVDQRGNYSGGNRTGNRTFGQGGRVPAPPTATAVITGNSVNETINLTSQNHDFSATATLPKKGTYQVNFTMTLGQRKIQKQFTLKVH